MTVKVFLSMSILMSLKVPVSKSRFPLAKISNAGVILVGKVFVLSGINSVGHLAGALDVPNNFISTLLQPL